ncbi:hypothetical protein MIFL109517_09575 [Micrococcus flavus]
MTSSPVPASCGAVMPERVTDSSPAGTSTVPSSTVSPSAVTKETATDVAAGAPSESITRSPSVRTISWPASTVAGAPVTGTPFFA